MAQAKGTATRRASADDAMAKYGASDQGALEQLASRIPKALHHNIKMHCTANGEKIIGFLARALANQLALEGAQVYKLPS